jgi:23S rRNA (uracil1939-C5)-methyltransferase
MAKFFTPKKTNKSNQSSKKATNHLADGKQAYSEDKHPRSSSTLDIDAHDHAGNGLCLSSDPITVVADALLGEVCQVRFTKETKKVNFAAVTKILKPSELRVAPFCQYYAQCGGCSLQHTSAKHGLALKQKALQTFVQNKLKLPSANELDDKRHLALSKNSMKASKSSLQQSNSAINIAKNSLQNDIWQPAILSDIDYSDDPVNTGYRRRIKLAVDARNKEKIKIGFRSSQSQSIVDIAKCAISSSAINDCLVPLRNTLIQLPSVQKIGHIVITEGSNSLQVALFTSQNLCKKSISKLSDLANLATLNIVVKAKSGDTICLPLDSSEAQSTILVEDMPKIVMAVESSDFLQVNKAVNQRMIKTAKQWLAPSMSHTLYDFFCGSGNFSLSFAHDVGSVKGFEVQRKMVDMATLNAATMDLNNVEFTKADLSAKDELKTLILDETAIVILDPSRDGALALCQYLSTHRVEKVLYVSCNPNSFVRDASVLLGKYELSKISALDMFPFTKHLEVMALFTRLANT